MANYYGDTEILIQEDFLTEEQADYLVTVLELQGKSKWTTEDPSDFWDGRYIMVSEIQDFDVNVLIDIEIRARILYENFYPQLKDKVSYSYIHSINRFGTGAEMPVHSDRGPYDTNNDIVHGFVIYLNDDYEGGEIYYPEKGISIKPKKYSLVVHPGNEEYKHGVSKITRGHRYALTMFVHETLEKYKISSKDRGFYY